MIKLITDPRLNYPSDMSLFGPKKGRRREDSEPITMPSTTEDYSATSHYDYFKHVATQAIRGIVEIEGVPYSLVLNSFMERSLEGTLNLLENPPEELLQDDTSFVGMVSQGARRCYALYDQRVHDGEEIDVDELRALITHYAERMKEVQRRKDANSLVRKTAGKIAKNLLKMVEREEKIAQGEPCHLHPNKWTVEL